MKINFALVGLAAAQSGEGKDYEYEYPAASEDRWEFSNGVTFTDFSGKNTGNLDSANFVKALKLSCWNSNMVRDMNNDNKFQRYTSGSPTDESAQQGWKYALGDLTTGKRFINSPGRSCPQLAIFSKKKKRYFEKIGVFIGTKKS